MKIAICLSGEPRNLDYIWNDLKSKINQPNADIYIHTWHSQEEFSTLPLHNERGGEKYQKILNQSTSSQYIKLVNPVDFIVEDFKSSEPNKLYFNKNRISTIERVYSMYYCIQKVTNLLKLKYYDAVIRLRPDIFIEDV
jgi:hypothetical protein